MARHTNAELFFTSTILFAIKACPFDYTIAIAIKAFTRVFFNVDEEANFSRIFGAATFAIAISTLVVNNSVNRRTVHAESESFQLVLFPILFVDGNDIMLTHPLFGHLTFDTCKVASPSATVIFDTFFAAGLRPGRVPREICLMPNGVSDSR